MMILKQRKVRLSNEDVAKRRIHYSTLGIHLAAVKVAQCIQVDENRKEKYEAKNLSAKKTATRNFHLQLKRFEAFDR